MKIIFIAVTVIYIRTLKGFNTMSAHNIICNCCDKYFINNSKYYIDDHRYKNKLIMNRCKNCDLIHTLLSSNTVTNEIDIDKNKKIKITYNVITETHDGYCSDPYDSNEYCEEITFLYPLIVGISEENISNQIIDNHSTNKINYYQKRFTECEKDSGYCGMYKIYEIKDINIVS